ncbi:hypothetical protein D4R75_14520 [bacterium]|nr:MAG: hypothetical protein D4R75_14520 [bacterium]
MLSNASRKMCAEFAKIWDRFGENWSPATPRKHPTIVGEVPLDCFVVLDSLKYVSNIFRDLDQNKS